MISSSHENVEEGKETSKDRVQTYLCRSDWRLCNVMQFSLILPFFLFLLCFVWAWSVGMSLQGEALKRTLTRSRIIHAKIGRGRAGARWSAGGDHI
jgi:hypothetical protein